MDYKFSAARSLLQKRPVSSITLTTTTSRTRDFAQAPMVIQDQGIFVYPTGDKYEGFFEAKKKDKSVKMQGPGVYTSAQGDSYTGYWENDKLQNMELITATYPDGSRYEGPINNWKYAGSGRYSYPDGTAVSCQFADNCPAGDMTLVDPNGHLWLGTAEKGFAWFHPVNHYYDILESRKDLVNIRKKMIKVRPPQKTEE